jgi:hypothetical protein
VANYGSAVGSYFEAGKRAAEVYASEAALHAYARALAIRGPRAPSAPAVVTALTLICVVLAAPSGVCVASAKGYRTDIESCWHWRKSGYP